MSKTTVDKLVCDVACKNYQKKPFSRSFFSKKRTKPERFFWEGMHARPTIIKRNFFLLRLPVVNGGIIGEISHDDSYDAVIIVL